MQTSENINELAAALAKAQATMGKAAKDSTNPHFRSKYADLSSITDACREALTANSIAVVQAPGTMDDGAVSVTTRLVHASGQWFESVMACRPMKPDAQSMGSVVTYLRRYALAAMAGVAPEDDDGNAAVGRDEFHATAPQSPPARRQPPKAPNQPAQAVSASKRAGEAPRGDSGLPDIGIEYVNAAGEVEEMPLDEGVRRLRRAHAAVDKLDPDGWAHLYDKNVPWLNKHAPDVASELVVRG